MTSSSQKIREFSKMLLLVLLYTIQGVPNGLAFGSIPYLIKQKTSYTDVGIFSLAQYPYSLKLLWSPIVDSLYFKSIGRRKSWILPIQMIAGILLLVTSCFIDDLFAAEKINVFLITMIFFSLICLMATQDIAVDGWAISILSKDNVSYASTCQTIGLSLGFFMSFTIFLALNSVEFCNTYLRTIPSTVGVLSLSGYLRFWGFLYLIITLFLALFVTEEQTKTQVLSVKEVYKQIFSIICLPNMRTLILILLTFKIGFSFADNIVPLKFVDLGLGRDNMALIVTIAFPFEFIFAILAGRWASSNSIMKPFKFGYVTRLIVGFLSAILIFVFPSSYAGNVPLYFFLLIMTSALMYSLCSNFLFVSVGCLFASIADPAIGGTYMTLLHTFSNFGGTWPKFFIFSMMDLFTVKRCSNSSSACSSDQDCPNKTCHTVFDGFYLVVIISLCIGIISYSVSIPILDRLQKLSPASWKSKKPSDFDSKASPK